MRWKLCKIDRRQDAQEPEGRAAGRAARRLGPPTCRWTNKEKSSGEEGRLIKMLEDAMRSRRPQPSRRAAKEGQEAEKLPRRLRAEQRG